MYLLFLSSPIESCISLAMEWDFTWTKGLPLCGVGGRGSCTHQGPTGSWQHPEHFKMLLALVFLAFYLPGQALRSYNRDCSMH